MTKKSAKAEINSFTGGLITEASPLNFPPNAAVDIVNFELNRDGTLDRRLGFGLENDAFLDDIPVSKDDIITKEPVVFEWIAVNGDPLVNILVVKTGLRLAFYNRDVPTISLGYLNELTLSSVFNTGDQMSFTSVDGKLIVAGGAETVAIITYNSTSESFSVTYERIKVRDLWGVECTTGDTKTETDISYRPKTLSDQHYYNLQNQSWGIPRRLKENAGSIGDCIVAYGPDGESGFNFYPSNSEVVWTGIQFQPVVGTTPPREQFFTKIYNDVIGADVLAPKGYFIIDLLRRGQSRLESFVTNYNKYPTLSKSSVLLKADYTTGGATVVAQFAGRVFYAGFSGTVIDGDKRSPGLANYVAFSQLVRSISDITKCYQEGDPTSRENSDIVDTDGGFIRIAGAEGIVAMKDIGTSLIVFAKNGVWSIDGGSDYGFSATNYKVKKLSSFGCVGKNTIVENSERLFYWGANAIYVISRDQFGDLSVGALTDTTIQTYYKNISGLSKERAYGVNDEINKKIRWVFNNGSRFTNTSETIELVLDLVLSAFYPLKISRSVDASLEVYCPFNTGYYTIPIGTENVLVNTDQVISGTDNVVVPTTGRQNLIQGVRYIVIRDNAGSMLMTIGLYNGANFEDWHNVTGQSVDAKAYSLTGSLTAGDSSVVKQTPYLTMHFRRTETGVDAELNPINQSSCLVRTQWDWSNSINSGKWSNLQQAYKYRRPYFAVDVFDEYDTGFELVSSRLKQRGRGRSFAVYFETEPGKDCRIVGWNINLNGNSFT